MSLLRNILAALVFVTGSFAFAQEFEEIDLGDLMTPAELMEDVGIGADGILWKASTMNPRVKLVVDRAAGGTSRTAQTLEIYIDDQHFKTVKVSTGKETSVTTPGKVTYTATTPPGEFRITRRVRNHKSKKWDGVPMNFAQFFNGGIAFHATNGPKYEAKLGSRDSGGCVRLHPTEAEMLWELVETTGVSEVKVIVYDSSYQKHPLQPKISYDYDEPQPIFGRNEPLPTPQPRATPQPQYQPQQPQHQPPTYYPGPPSRPQRVEQYPQPYPQPDSRYVPEERRTDPYARPRNDRYAPSLPYPTEWRPSANPTPPPRPAYGQPDTYPYCYDGYWCPRPVRRR